VTPSNTPSPTQLPNCFTDPSVQYQYIGYGVAGTGPITNLNASAGVPLSGGCPGYTIGAYAMHRVAIDLGPNTELGYPLDINLCTGNTNFDSTLFAGLGCPFS
jgi:hypothetical protein